MQDPNFPEKPSHLTDFSPVAEGAAPFALALARRYGAKVFALHVRAPQAYGMAPPESRPVLEEAANALAKDQVKHLGELFAGVEHHAMIEEGDVWDAASALIEKNDVDLIVARNSSWQKHRYYDSVAEKIFRLAPCPVLTMELMFGQDARTRCSGSEEDSLRHHLLAGFVVRRRVCHFSGAGESARRISCTSWTIKPELVGS